jgi:hypothetical protein
MAGREEDVVLGVVGQSAGAAARARGSGLLRLVVCLPLARFYLLDGEANCSISTVLPSQFQDFAYDDPTTALNYKQEIGPEICQQQKPDKAICSGSRANSSPTEKLRANP